MSEKENEGVSLAELKKPMKIIGKVVKGLIGGLGAITQEVFSRKLRQMITNNRIEMAAEYISVGVANGLINNEYLNTFFNGMLGGTMKDTVKQLIDRFSQKTMLSAGSTAPPVSNKTIGGFGGPNRMII